MISKWFQTSHHILLLAHRVVVKWFFYKAIKYYVKYTVTVMMYMYSIVFIISFCEPLPDDI